MSDSQYSRPSKEEDKVKHPLGQHFIFHPPTKQAPKPYVSPDTSPKEQRTSSTQNNAPRTQQTSKQSKRKLRSARIDARHNAE